MFFSPPLFFHPSPPFLCLFHTWNAPRSTRYSLPVLSSSSPVTELSFWCTVTEKTEWERLEVLFIFVALVRRFSVPRRISSNTCQFAATHVAGRMKKNKKKKKRKEQKGVVCVCACACVCVRACVRMGAGGGRVRHLHLRLLGMGGRWEASIPRGRCGQSRPPGSG